MSNKAFSAEEYGTVGADVGDMMVIYVGEVLVVGIINGVRPMRVLFGDVEREVRFGQGLAIPRWLMGRGAGQFIGKSFESMEELRDAMDPHYIERKEPTEKSE